MKTQQRLISLLAVLPLLVGIGCSQVRAKAAFKDANKLYKEENYRRAIERYEKAISLAPDMSEAYCYVASAHQALYRPGKEDEQNKQQLEQAIQNYLKSIEVNKGNTENLKKVKVISLGALTSIYSEPPYQDFEKALSYAQQLTQDNPDDTKNLYAIANLYEKFGKVDDAEKTYKRITDLHAQDVKACAALAGFYNKALWDDQGVVYDEKTSKGGRRAKFDLAIETLQRCATLDPKDASGYFKVATFFWDKAYRDPLVTEAQKAAYTEKGLEAVEKALEIKPDYWEAIVYKGLLYRVKALISKNPKERAQFLEQAAALTKRAMDIKKTQQAENAAVPPEAAAAAGGGESPAPASPK
jgi:tetratricopeptide (TPR) repeat protein